MFIRLMLRKQLPHAIAARNGPSVASFEEDFNLLCAEDFQKSCKEPKLETPSISECSINSLIFPQCGSCGSFSVCHFKQCRHYGNASFTH